MNVDIYNVLFVKRYSPPLRYALNVDEYLEVSLKEFRLKGMIHYDIKKKLYYNNYSKKLSIKDVGEFTKWVDFFSLFKNFSIEKNDINVHFRGPNDKSTPWFHIDGLEENTRRLMIFLSEPYVFPLFKKVTPDKCTNKEIDENGCGSPDDKQCYDETSYGGYNAVYFEGLNCHSSPHFNEKGRGRILLLTWSWEKWDRDEERKILDDIGIKIK